jgi:hypothetical protein
MSRPISRGELRMEKLRPSASTRTKEFTPRELPLAEVAPPSPPLPNATARRSERIRDLLRRWFDEEL